MTGMEIFAVLFLAFVCIGLPLCMFLEYGGLELIAEKFVRFIESYMEKRRDI